MVAFKWETQDTGMATLEWAFHLHPSHSVFSFKYFGLCNLPHLWIPLVPSLHYSYGLYIFLVLIHLWVYVLFLLLDRILLEIMVLNVVDIERLLS